MREEIWKPVVGYEKLYEVSSLGRVRRMARQRIDSLGKCYRESVRYLKETSNHSVYFADNEKYVEYPLRSIVAATFLGTPYYTAIVHLNGDVSDCRVCNLVSADTYRQLDADWRDIPGFPDYQVSRFGQVRSIARYITTKRGTRQYVSGGILSTTSDSDGYLHVTVVNSGTPYVVSVHRIVALTWILNPDRKPTVNHKDGNKQNNNVTNLEWASQQEQIDHACRTGLKKCNWKATREVAVRCIETDQKYSSIIAAAKAIGSTVDAIMHSVKHHHAVRGLHFVADNEADYSPLVSDLDDEIWFQVCGYESSYAVSNRFRVKSLSRSHNCATGTRISSERLVSPDAHQFVPLYNGNGRCKYYKVSDLYTKRGLRISQNKSST